MLCFRHLQLTRGLLPAPRDNTTLPQNTMILPTASNGDCFYHSILALFIGKKVARDDPLVTQFRNRLMDLALENRNKIVTDGESDSGCKPTIVTFYHEPYEECCELNETHPEKTVHPKFLPVETSTSKGIVKVHNFEEWNTVHRERYSWADADITTIIACITGFTIYASIFLKYFKLI